MKTLLTLIASLLLMGLNQKVAYAKTDFFAQDYAKAASAKKASKQ